MRVHLNHELPIFRRRHKLRSLFVRPLEVRLKIDCTERDQLVEKWNGAVKVFAHFLDVLACGAGDFKERYRDTELARLNAENARVMLEQHRKDHGC